MNPNAGAAPGPPSTSSSAASLLAGAGHAVRRGRVCVVGLGYIGLPTSAVLASQGFEVHGVEVDARAREIINSGRAHIIEPDLEMLVRAGIESGRLRAHAEPGPAEVFMLCVPTPVGEAKEANLDYVRAATRSIGPHLVPGNLVVLESTCPPGTTEMVADIVHETTDLARGSVHFAHAPERVLPGKILQEVVQNDRIVGGLDEASTDAACKFFGTFVKGQLIRCSSRTAEMSKLVENASRDVQIAFANEVSMVCEGLGIDARELIEIANHHPRVNILEPGCGVGGHCIAVDPWFIVHMAPKDARLIRAAREVNDTKARWVVERVVEAASRIEEPVVACLGATYKPDIDDLRESPALAIAHDLSASPAIARTVVVEPNVEEIPGLPRVGLEDAVAEADVLVFLVAHREFKALDPASLDGKTVFDYCGALRRTRA